MYKKRSVIVKKGTKARKALIEAVFERDFYQCQVCGGGSRDQLTIHHIYPTGRCRIDHIDNLLTVCTCHVPWIHDANYGFSVDMLIDKYWGRIEHLLKG